MGVFLYCGLSWRLAKMCFSIPFGGMKCVESFVLGTAAASQLPVDTGTDFAAHVWSYCFRSVLRNACGKPYARCISIFSDHGLRGSASPVLTATGFVNGRWQFSTPPPTESTLLDRPPKNLLLVITSATPTAVPNLVQIRQRGASGQMGEI